MKVTIYSDGGCIRNGQPFSLGAWCCVILFNGKEMVVTGTEPDTTNNRMEIAGVIQCLNHILQQGIKDIEIVSDSMYCIYGVRNWKSWKRKKNVINRDMWENYWRLMERYNPKISTKWVKGHSGDYYNELCNAKAAELLGMGYLK